MPEIIYFTGHTARQQKQKHHCHDQFLHTWAYVYIERKKLNNIYKTTAPATVNFRCHTQSAVSTD